MEKRKKLDKDDSSGRSVGGICWIDSVTVFKRRQGSHGQNNLYWEKFSTRYSYSSCLVFDSKGRSDARKIGKNKSSCWWQESHCSNSETVTDTNAENTLGRNTICPRSNSVNWITICRERGLEDSVKISVSEQ